MWLSDTYRTRCALLVHVAHLQADLGLPSGAKDVDWLPLVGAKKWILITKDERIRRRPIEIQAYIGSGVRGFVMTGAGEWRGVDQGELIAKALPAMIRMAQRDRRPFIANITASGYVERIEAKNYLPGSRRRKTPASLISRVSAHRRRR